MSKQSFSDFQFPFEVCGIFKISEVLSDKWTILILREAFYGVTKFSTFIENTGISKQVLSNRLKHLIQEDIFSLSIYKMEGDRERKEYLLTPKGKSLNIVLLAMLESGGNFIHENKDVVKVFSKNDHELVKLKLVDSKNNIINFEDIELRLVKNN
ncbi:winged helix-turn-helix transcriptional regulator [Acinetobacter nematophilus]|uniref:winged helix-turn-helix transcriptional regulator n=1 Tax=Acinetobacter nematophilus TaxID=2994642 RepID=UPI003AF88278